MGFFHDLNFITVHRCFINLLIKNTREDFSYLRATFDQISLLCFVYLLVFANSKFVHDLSFDKAVNVVVHKF